LKTIDENLTPIKTSDLAEDILFELEQCEKGPCLDQVKKPNMPVM